MKVAISGKGGTGKTTLAGVMARILAARGHRVLAIDADPDANLASALGISQGVMEGLSPLSEMKEFIEERTAAQRGSYGSFFKLNPKVDDIPERFSITTDGVRMLLLGNIPQGGGGCFCPENALLRSLLSHIFIERDDYVIVDMEAGLEHLGRGTTAYMDALVVVVEPGRRSFQTARQVERLAGDLGVRKVFLVANKVRSDDDSAMIREHAGGIPLLGIISFDEAIIEADKLGFSPYDSGGRLRGEVEAIVDALARYLA